MMPLLSHKLKPIVLKWVLPPILWLSCFAWIYNSGEEAGVFKERARYEASVKKAQAITAKVNQQLAAKATALNTERTAINRSVQAKEQEVVNYVTQKITDDDSSDDEDGGCVLDVDIVQSLNELIDQANTDI
ncbi:MAG: hypothetical protein AAGF06_08040 [Pseudomonadota bacterium]